MSFQRLSRPDRIAVFILLCGGMFVAISIAVFIWFLNDALRALYGGTLFAHLVKLRRHAGPFDFDTYIRSGRLLFSRLCLGTVFLDLAVAAWVSRRTVSRLLVEFFTERVSPFNLAFFRVAVFGVILCSFSMDFADTIWFAGFPKVLQVAPYGTAWLLPYLPINPQIARVASIVFMALCVTGILGIQARASAFLAALVGLYVLGITQFYGKVSHNHEYIWFLVLLAVGPCADALSVDAVFAARRHADLGSTELPADSLAYGLPLRFASVLLGFIYFFPGFWKFWNCGFDWAFSDNLKYQMYSKWTEFPGWVPLFRLDLHPWLYRSVAFATLVIEMSFVFLIFSRRLRRVAALGAASFHIGCDFLLRILFWELMIFYIALFDLHGVFCKIGGRVFKTPLLVFYDDDCSHCRRTIAVIRTVDILGAIRYVRARQDAGLYLSKYPGQDAALLQDMQSICGNRRFAGMRTYREIVLRIPFFWPLILLLQIDAIFGLSENVYKRVKRKRMCDISRANPTPSCVRPVKWIMAVGVLVVAGSFYTGALGIYAGWPFACFPTFANLAGPLSAVLQIEAFDQDGRVLTTNAGFLDQAFADQRLRGMLDSVLNNPGKDDSRLLAVWQLCLQQAPSLKSAHEIRFYRAMKSTIPGDKFVAERNLIAEVDVRGSIRSR
jgi:predicted DCC family thiol-disulfide oxidoreductase YuxK